MKHFYLSETGLITFWNKCKSMFVQTTTLTTELAKKVDKEIGKSLSSNDYTNEDKTKLTSITEISNDFINSLE